MWIFTHGEWAVVSSEHPSLSSFSTGDGHGYDEDWEGNTGDAASSY